MPAVKVGDINMYYEIHGGGDPLVVIPGITCDITTCLFRQIPGLANHYQVVAIDNRGSGMSDKPDIPYSMDMMVKDVAGLLDSIGIRKAHICGESLGGMIAQNFALCYPEVTASLVLACTHSGGKHMVKPDQAVMAAFFDMHGTPEERLRRVLPLIFSQGFMSKRQDVVEHFVSLRLEHPSPAHAFMRQAEAAMTHDTYDRLPEIGVPTLVTAGTEDKLFPVENSRILASRIHGAESAILEGVGHFMSVEAPEAVNRAIHDFLRRHPIAA